MHGINALLACADLRALLQPRVLTWRSGTGMNGAHAMRAFDSQAVKKRLEPSLRWEWSSDNTTQRACQYIHI